MNDEIEPVGFTDDTDWMPETDSADWALGIMWIAFTIMLALMQKYDVLLDIISIFTK